MKKMIFSTFAATMTLLQTHTFAEKYSHDVEVLPSDTPAKILEKAANVVPSPRQLAYHQEEFIGFIHFGINTFTGREWGNGKESPKDFVPTEVDTDQWCRVMKKAGMKKIMMTIKHHDGFCLWQTRYNDKFSVKASPWKDGKGDVLKLLSKSAAKYGLKLGVYISPADLYQIENVEGLYGNLSKYQDTIIPTDPASFKTNPTKQRKVSADLPTFKVKADDYNRYMMNQLYEALTEYGPVHEVWFDGAHPKRKGGQVYIKTEWFKMIRKLAPQAVIFGGPDVRWCGNEHGGTRANEWNVLSIDNEYVSGYDRPAEDIGSEKMVTAPGYSVYGERFKNKNLYYLISEVDTSVRNGWFWRNDDEQSVHTADWAFDIYERSVGGNSVFLLNVPPNKYGKFSPRDVAMMKETGRRIRATYGKKKDLAKGADVSVKNLRDGKIETFWQAKSKKAQFTVKLPKAQKVNRFMLQEAISKVGQRVKSHAVDAWLDGQWKEISKAGVIGYKRIHRFNSVTTDQFRVRILDSRVEAAAIAEIGAFYYEAPPTPVTIVRNGKGKVELLSKTTGHQSHIIEDAVIYYTLDGSKPTKKSMLYSKALDLPNGGLIKAVVLKGKASGPITETLLGLSAKGWKAKVTSQQKGWEASKAIDGNSKTFWHTSWTGNAPSHPHSLTIDTGNELTIGGFAYLPRQDRRIPDGMIEAWKVEVSLDGKKWKKVQSGEFGNLVNDPSERPVYFKKNQKMRYFRLTSLRGARGKQYAAAAELKLLPAK